MDHERAGGHVTLPEIEVDMERTDHPIKSSEARVSVPHITASSKDPMYSSFDPSNFDTGMNRSYAKRQVLPWLAFRYREPCFLDHSRKFGLRWEPFD